MIWKHFPHYWPFVSKIHQSPVFSRHKGPLIRILDAFFVLSLDKLVKKTVEWVMNLDDTTLMWRHWMTCFVFRKPWCGDFFFTRGRFWPSGIVIACGCMCVCAFVCACMCVRQPRKLVHKKTHYLLKLEPPNSGKRYKSPWLKSLLFLVNWLWPSRSNWS